MNKLPWTVVAVFGITVAGIIALILTGNGNNELFTILIALLPSTLTTNWLAGRVVKQTSNGHVKDAMKQAITETAQEGTDGVKDAVVAAINETDSVKEAVKQAITETAKEGNNGPVHG